LAEAEAAITSATVSIAQAQDELDRGRALVKRDPGVVARYKLVELENNVKAAQADKIRAQAVRDSAQLDLEFTEVRASVDGYVSNLELRLGSQAVASRAVLALIDRNSFWVHGFFKESELAGMSEGDRAKVTLMTYPDQPLDGVVDSIDWGIAQQDGSPGHNLLPSVSPTFQWIRLAQRVPVRVHLLQVPKGINLRAGTTASVLVSKQKPTEP
jgi:multidrug resistance efflux pump